MCTMLRLDLETIGKDLLAAFKWIRAHMSLVQTKTMNMVLTANPITVITKLIPEEIILKKLKKKNPKLIKNPPISDSSRKGPSWTVNTNRHRQQLPPWVSEENLKWATHAGTKDACFSRWVWRWKVNQIMTVWEGENWDCCIVPVTQGKQTLEGMVGELVRVRVRKGWKI